jgi:hypothetical protein
MIHFDLFLFHEDLMCLADMIVRGILDKEPVITNVVLRIVPAIGTMIPDLIFHGNTPDGLRRLALLSPSVTRSVTFRQHWRVSVTVAHRFLPQAVVVDSLINTTGTNSSGRLEHSFVELLQCFEDTSNHRALIWASTIRPFFWAFVSRFIFRTITVSVTDM